MEDDESWSSCLVRELKEETGIEISSEEVTPFLVIKYLCKDYPSLGINSKYISNYYYLKTDKKPDYSKMALTKNEKEGMFELKFIHKDKVLGELENSLQFCTKEGPIIDTIEAVKEYLKITR